MKAINRLFCSLIIAGACSLNGWAQENQSYFLHTVEKGQSLYSIASMYSLPIDEIVKLNPGSDQKIYVGHSLRIPRQAANVQQETYHTIKAGETLYRLTTIYNVSAQDICNANPGLSASNFRIGQVIRIPQSNKPEAEQQKAAASQTNIPAPVQSRCQEMHKVKRKETVFSISRQYGISQDELIAANPELKKGGKLKKGTLLCIPYASATNKQTSSTQTTPTDKQLFNESKKETERYHTLKAAVILPFGEGVSKSESARMVEYYEGLLVAVDSLKRTGTSIDLYAYNSGPENSSLQPLLAKPELKEMDIVFGPLYQSHIKTLSEFCQQNQIRLVVPFKQNNTVFRNPSVFQINTPQSYLYSEVYDHFLRQFPGANVVFIEATDGGVKDKAEFIKGLKEELRNRGYSTKSVKEDVTAEVLKGTLDLSKSNIFVPTSGSNLALIKILPQLVLTVREQPEANVHLFGYPEWQTYTKDHLDEFFELDTYFYSSFYTNNLLPAAIHFTNSYRKWYNKEMDERYPKFGMLGFDTGYYFLKGLSRYGSAFEQEMGKMDYIVPIQTGFKFQRVNNWGGFINKKVFFVRFTKNYELIKLDFD
ncbi:MAG: LysM peptidoglycan-binding domain-containing protein [Bacteroides sp.]|nr:LysM peptidoglycan-binding domain-containing protein [Bacteroides sp.]